MKMLNGFKKCSLFLVTAIVLLCLGTAGYAETPCKAEYGKGETVVRLATGSPGELGLVEALAAAFNRKNSTRICWKKAGSGKSLKLLKAREVDVVMVHAPAAEKKAVSEGWAINRSLIGSNEFYIVGPSNDPAGIAAAKNAADAYAKIAAAGAPFLSRSDNSGTHKKEMFIWKTAGIAPAGSWYIITQTFMLASLRQADQIGGYFMTDSSTWVAAKKEMKQTRVLFRGDPVLINTYHALCQPPGVTSTQPLAADFVDFISSEAGQSVIRAYGVNQHGEGLYNDAAYAQKYDH
jgi:tungstate transport system substrate-binding protein